MEERFDKQDQEFREFFANISPEPISDALKGRIMAEVKLSRDNKYSLESDKKALVAAIIISIVLLGAAVWLLYYFKLMPSFDNLQIPAGGSNGFKFSLPRIDFGGVGVWVMICAVGSVLLIGESLLARHFIGKRKDSKIP